MVLVALALAAGATAASGQTTTTTAPLEPGLGIRLVEIPADRQDDVRARSYIVDHVSPGSSFSRKVEVSNGTDEAMDVALYAGPATVENGTFVFGDPGTSSELTGWVSVEPATLQIGSGQRSIATVTVTVPGDAAAGERYGVVWAETRGAPPADGGVAINNRIGVRIYLSVGAGGEPPTDFSLETFQPVVTDDGDPAVVIETCNDGGRAVDITGEVSLTDGPGGTSAGPFTTENATTFGPGECGDVTVKMSDGLPKGPWNATARLRSGTTERAAKAEITFPDAGRGEKVDAKGLDTPGGRLALIFAVLALLAVLAGLALLVRGRSTRPDNPGPTSSR